MPTIARSPLRGKVLLAEPAVTAADIARGLKARRSGKGWMARCPAHEDRSPSLSIREGEDGRVLVHCFACCSQDAVIDALRVRGLWPARERRDFTRAERRDWARQRQAIERDLCDAGHWRRAAVALGDAVLDDLKAGLSDPTKPQPTIDELSWWTREVARWERLDGAGLVAECAWWRQHQPELTVGLIHGSRFVETAWARALIAYFTDTETGPRQCPR